ncbi:MAG TPA: PLP-dependent aminotransferase family protein, partial [Methylomirabilota bacterium]|nr:PLP-dependent aminotransferase family protein [Methylomirabilota bacterium]
MDIPLDRDKPLARQIQTHLERLIGEGLLAPGVKLPATRELAGRLRVNRATVALAYAELVATGLAHAHVGQGTFVAGPLAGRALPPPARPAPIDWDALLSRAARIAAADEERLRRLGAGNGAGAAISFAGGMPDSALFPTDAFRRVLNQVVREDGAALLQYSPVGGYAPLRRYLAGYLLRFGVEARAEEILIVNGAQQGFNLIARTLLDPGDAVAIEQPTYTGALQGFRAAGARLLPVDWDAAGPRPDVFERLCERQGPKLFYCQSGAQNPTGLTLEPEAGRRLVAAATRHQVPIVEDGFDGGLHYGPRPGTPLKAADRAGIVIHIGTFSRILFPGLRLGWLVAPPPLVERLQAAKQLADLHTSALLQAAVHRFCERRLLERHASRLTAEYAQRRTLLLTALRRRMPDGVTWTEP